MSGSEINPYESPQLGNADLRVPNRFLQALGRLIGMGLVGYGSFTAFGLIYWAVADYLNLDATLQWALGVGVVGAVIFLASEIFDSGAGHEAGALRRILVTSAVFVAASVIMGVLSDALGWNQRTYTEDPWWVHNTVLGLAVLGIGLGLARVLWIGTTYRDAKL